MTRSCLRLSSVACRLSEPPLLHIHRVARTHGTIDRHGHAQLLAVDETGDDDGLAEGARRETAGDRHRGLDGHVRDIGVLARLGDLAEDEERAIGLDLDRDVRLADVTLAQLVGYPARKAVGRPPAPPPEATSRL